MRKITGFLSLLFVGALPLLAQSDPGVEKPLQPARKAWFACTSIPDGFENPTMVMSGKNIVDLKLPRYMTSDPVKIPEDGVIRLVRQVPDPEDASKMKFLVLAEATIAENVREALIILFPLPKPKGDLIFSTMVQNLASFKGGDRMFINLSDTPIRVNFGPVQVKVAPKKANIYHPKSLTKPTNMPVKYEFYHSVQKRWRILTASTVVLRPTRREINIFNEGSRIGNIKKHKVLFPVEMIRR